MGLDSEHELMLVWRNSLKITGKLSKPSCSYKTVTITKHNKKQKNNKKQNKTKQNKMFTTKSYVLFFHSINLQEIDKLK